MYGCEACGLCPVRPACLAGALQRGEPWGRGGDLFDARRGHPAEAPARAPAEVSPCRLTAPASRESSRGARSSAGGQH